MRRRRLCVAALASLVPALQIGCASPVPPPPNLPPQPPITPNPKLFARAPAAVASRTRGRVALLVRPDVLTTTTVVWGTFSSLQVGSMVEQALILALDEGLQGGVQQIGAKPPVGSPFDAVLELRWANLDFRLHTFPPRMVALAFDFGILDGQGRALWSKIYHDAKDYSIGEQLALVYPGETAMDAEVRLAHEAAWRLAQQVLRDLREWLETERLRPREL